jgi:hypothetical protein
MEDRMNGWTLIGNVGTDFGGTRMAAKLCISARTGTAPMMHGECWEILHLLRKQRGRPLFGQPNGG